MDIRGGICPGAGSVKGSNVRDVRKCIYEGRVIKIAKFVKGVSGNPGGRPKTIPEVKEILKAASPDAVRTLVELLNSEKDSIRLAAAQDILNRTQGKPLQMQDINMDVSGMPNVEMQVRKILMESVNVERMSVNDGRGAA